MDYLKIASLPEVKFAHTFDAEKYDNYFPKRCGTAEISYLKEGELRVVSGGVQTVARAGDILCTLFRSDIEFHASRYHCHHTVSASANFIFCSAPEEDSVFLSQIISSPNHGRFEELIDKLIYAKRISPERKLKCSGLFLQLIDELSEECKKNEREKDVGGYSYVGKAKKYIYDNIERRVSQKEIAAHLGITPEYLCSVFKKYTGDSVIKFINSRKLENICVIMKKENVPLYRAAEMYGFNDPNYVSRLYRKYYGVNITDDSKKVT